MKYEDFVGENEKIIFQEEKYNLEKNLNIIDKYSHKHKERIKMINEELNSIPPHDCEYAMYKKSILEERELAHQEVFKKANLKKNPYFGRIKLEENSKEIDMYIGEKSFADTNGNQIIYDWRAPVSGMFYQNQNNYSYNGYSYLLKLKRKIWIENTHLKKCYDIYSDKIKDQKVTDEFLQRVLENKKNDSNFTDIIKTIQVKQNEIIRDNLNDNIIVQGVAGSGKTVIILHRLSYMLYNNPEINPKSFLFIAPTNIFKNKLSELNKQLQIDKIEINTLLEYYKNKMQSIFFEKTHFENAKGEKKSRIDFFTDKVINDEHFEENHIINKYSDDYYNSLLTTILNNVKVNLKKVYELIEFDAFDLQKESLVEYSHRFKDAIEEAKAKLLENKNTVQNNIEEYFVELHVHLNRQLNFSKEKSKNFRNFNNSASLEEMYKIISLELREMRNQLSEEDQNWLNIKKQLNLKIDKLQEEIKNLGVSKLSFEVKIQNELLKFNNYGVSIDFGSENFNLEKYINWERKIQTKLKDDIVNINDSLDSINKKLKKIDSSIFKMFNQDKIKKLKNEIEKLNAQKETKKNNLTNFVETKETSQISLILNEYDKVLQKFNDNNDEINKLKEKNAFIKDREVFKILIIEQINEYLYEVSKKLNMYSGIVEVENAEKKLKSCFTLLYNGYKNVISEQHFNYQEKFEKTIMGFEKETIIKREEELGEAIQQVVKIGKPKLVWNAYIECLGEQEKEDSPYLAASLNKRKRICRNDAYILLRLATDLGYSRNRQYNYIYMDEAQDYNDSEIKTIYQLEGKPTLNIYGDINQRIYNNVQKRQDWNSLKNNLNLKFKDYRLNENYRNTLEIVLYCNKFLSNQMVAVGISRGSVIEEKFSSIDDIVNAINDQESVVITNDDKYLEFLKNLNITSYKVEDVKSLEFPNVIVVDDNFTVEQKYVAYTRSLRNLHIFIK